MPMTVPLMVVASSLPAGTRLGRYEVIAELGTGGMATVYFGRALAVGGFQRLVAIKYLHPHLLKDQDFVQMFLDEGRLAARIHHPNVVATLDLEHTEQGIYIVSEYIEGDQLLGLYKTARAMQKRIPFPVTLRVGLDVLAGLHAAHELTDDSGAPLKIVHRDVSPQNVLVGTDGIARITDFGVAKCEERISNTREGIVKGKLSYMAPEQPNDEPIDRRADVFSAATVIWECFTGRRLFPGKTDGEVLKNLLHNPIPRLRDVDPELPQVVDAVLSKALSRDPSERYPTAGAFADALESAALAASFAIAGSRPVATYVRETASAKINTEIAMRRSLPTRELPAYRPPATPSEIRPITISGADAPTPPRGSVATMHPAIALGGSNAATVSDPPIALDLPRAARSSYPPESLSLRAPPEAAYTFASAGAVTTVLGAASAPPRPIPLLPLGIGVLGLGLLVGSAAWSMLKPAPPHVASFSSLPSSGVVVPTVRPRMTPPSIAALATPVVTPHVVTAPIVQPPLAVPTPPPAPPPVSVSHPPPTHPAAIPEGVAVPLLTHAAPVRPSVAAPAALPSPRAAAPVVPPPHAAHVVASPRVDPAPHPTPAPRHPAARPPADDSDGMPSSI